MTATELCELTATDLRLAYGSRRIASVDVMQAVLARVWAVDPGINALFYLAPEAVLGQVRAFDRRKAVSAPSGLLDGIPVSAKGSVAVAGMPSWRGCRGNMARPVPQPGLAADGAVGGSRRDRLRQDRDAGFRHARRRRQHRPRQW